MSKKTETATEEEKPKRRTRAKAKTDDVKEDKAPKKSTAKKATTKKTTTKRTTRKKAAATEAEAATGAAATNADATTEAVEGEASATKAKAPVRRRRTASKSDADDAPVDKDAASEAKESSEASASEPHEAATSGSPDSNATEENAHGDTESKDERDSDQRSERTRRGNDRRNRRKRKNQEVLPSVSLEDLAALKVADLRARAAELEIDATGMKKDEMIAVVYAQTLIAEGFRHVEGVLDVLSDGYGFLRGSSYLPGENDIYVGTSLIRRNGLRKGDYVTGTTRPMRENEKYAALQKIETVNDIPVDQLGKRVKFSELTPVYPDERLLMEHGQNTTTARVIDLTAPIGKGQRGLIVSPPKAGKTTILKDIAASITANNPEVHLMCLLVDERPEEVTDMERSIKGEVVSSTFDMPCENHIAVAELVIERAKRLVENGKDVVILLDSITRLARAYNLAQPASGRILSGGVDSTALYPPKRFLGAARNIEFGGSLTILASALIETGSKMDEVIFEEFKGTGNMELKLDRQLADRRIFPAIDPVTSGTRKEDLLLDMQEAPLIWAVRRLLANMNNTERAMDMLIKSLRQTRTNQEFLIRTAKKAQKSTGKIDEL